MKIIGLRILSQSDLIGVIFSNEPIAIDNAVIGLFSNGLKDKTEMPNVSFEEIQKSINQCNQSIVLTQEELRLFDEHIFARGQLLFLILQALRNKSQVRIGLVSYLAMILNKKYVLNNIFLKPYNILKLFQGECGLGSQLESLNLLPPLNQMEINFLLTTVPLVFNQTITIMNLHSLSFTMQIDELAFSMYIEASNANSDFLASMTDKKGLNRKIQQTADNIIDILQGTKYSRQTTSWVERSVVEWIGITRFQAEALSDVLQDQVDVSDANANAQTVQNQDNATDDKKKKGQQQQQQKQVQMASQTLIIDHRQIDLITFCLIDAIKNQFQVFQQIIFANKDSEHFMQCVRQQVNQLQQDFERTLKCEAQYKAKQQQQANLLFKQEQDVLQVTQFLLAEFIQSLQGILVVVLLFGLQKADDYFIKMNPKFVQDVSVPANQIKKDDPESQQQQQQQKQEQKQDLIYNENNKKTKAQQPAQGYKKPSLGKGTLFVYELYGKYFSVSKSQLTPDQSMQRMVQFQEYFKGGLIRDWVLQMYEYLLVTKGQVRRLPKVAKGARDYTPSQMTVRRQVFQIITDIFRKHGAVEIDTPVFELKETLTGKYGEESKLIYDLQDQGGELLALRYDLTIPFARYMATKNLMNVKRFHIAKVYRRDQPIMSKGRFREFYQCDFDIAGQYDPMLPDAEIVKIIDEILTAVDVGQFLIKVSSRKLLDAMVQLSGASHNKFKPICSAIDKLDKEPWSEVRRELIEDKGLTPQMADKIGAFCQYKGNPLEILKTLKEKQVFQNSQLGQEALIEMGLLFKYLDAMDGLKNVIFDLSLARGLDYYTGLIMEAQLCGSNVGSIGGGGRYDELIGMFSGKQIPSIGVSIGIERLFIILEEKHKESQHLRSSDTEVLVATIGKDMVEHKLRICQELWNNGIKAEYLYNEKPKPQKQLQYALDNYIPFILWIGEDEIQQNVVTLKSLYKGEENKVVRANLKQELANRIKIYYDDLKSPNFEFKKAV